MRSRHVGEGNTTRVSVVAASAEFCLRDRHSGFPFWDFHFILQNRRTDKPAAISFCFCVAAGTSRGSVFRPPCSRAIKACARVNNKEASPPGTYLIVFFPGRKTADFDGVVRPRDALVSSASLRARRCPQSTRETRRLP